MHVRCRACDCACAYKTADFCHSSVHTNHPLASKADLVVQVDKQEWLAFWEQYLLQCDYEVLQTLLKSTADISAIAELQTPELLAAKQQARTNSAHLRVHTYAHTCDCDCQICSAVHWNDVAASFFV